MTDIELVIAELRDRGEAKLASILEREADTKTASAINDMRGDAERLFNAIDRGASGWSMSRRPHVSNYKWMTIFRSDTGKRVIIDVTAGGTVEVHHPVSYASLFRHPNVNSAAPAVISYLNNQ